MGALLTEVIASLTALHREGRAPGLRERRAEPERQPTLPQPGLKRLLAAEQTERPGPSLRDLRPAARFPRPREWASVDFTAAPRAQPCRRPRATAAFTATAPHLRFSAGTGTGTSQWARARGVAAVQAGQRGRVDHRVDV